MIVLVLDPATSTGYCLVDLQDDTADIYEYGFIDVDSSSNYQGDHCLDLMERVKNLIDTECVGHIAIEDYFFSKRFATGCNVNGAYRTAIHILARQKGLEYTILNVSSWKTFVAGYSNPSREQKKLWGPGPAKKLFIQHALWTKYGFRFPNHSISETTGKPITFRNDIVDAVGQAVYYCGLCCGVRNITMSMEAAEDVVFKKPSKKRYVYSTRKS